MIGLVILLIKLVHASRNCSVNTDELQYMGSTCSTRMLPQYGPG
jgi:hypothetical protein